MALLVATWPSTTPAQAAEPLAAPVGTVLLVVSGDIESTNVDEAAHLDRAQLDALPRVSFTTGTPWSKAGPHEFEGVRLSAVLDLVGARGTRFHAIGVDDYAVVFEDVDLERYPVIVADTVDGMPLNRRTLGPLRIMFPFDDHPELDTDGNRAMSVWQLVGMDVH